MFKFLGTFKDLSKNKLSIFLIIFLIILFLYIGIFYYNKYVKKKIDPDYVDNKEFIKDTEEVGDDTTIYFFFTNWCPHCKTARPHWEQLKEKTGEVVNKVKITFKEIDCDIDPDTADKFNITGYPTIKLFYNNKIYDYDAKPHVETLELFLNSIIK